MPIRCKGIKPFNPSPTPNLRQVTPSSTDNLAPVKRRTAAVCRVSGEPLLIEEVEVAPPKAFEVRNKIICTSLCHSDLTIWCRQDFTPFLLRILGHEAFGAVESLGEGVKEMAVGDAVVPTFLSNCGECKDCRSEKSNFCSTVPFTRMPGMPRDSTTWFTDAAGRPLSNFLGVSSFSEYTVVDVTQVTKVDAALSPEKACLLGLGEFRVLSFFEKPRGFIQLLYSALRMFTRRPYIITETPPSTL